MSGRGFAACRSRGRTESPVNVESANRHQIRPLVGNCAQEGVGNGNVVDDGVLVAGVGLVPDEVSDQKVGEFIARIALVADIDDERLALTG
jgi:hypothetical protein